ncbi:hypothetical protein PLESTB_000890900 [Pleodorina starrii]|uniref:hydroxymethylglutaryl-CoA lyase n=1 Tax=Pleodorina starrii TaxID=330485 RepID=A0A9W6F3B5_9CHLO|nr:hypothetical protein PLESTM_002081100 [Pleodorina starrii]GLC54644.1 hypothetical protein PLESTB_000890900 [Pleodorina starrii]GLC66983.1 hypothetical protein PLESTF_000498700 [Pleodorina starrii]
MQALQQLASSACRAAGPCRGEISLSALSQLRSSLAPALQALFHSHSATAGNDLPARVTIYEVGPRDGLQNERKAIPTDVKVAFIDMLTDAGFKKIEATSFVSPKWVPQLGDAAEVMARIRRAPGVSYPVLVPNMQGLTGALASGCGEVAVFAAASETFSKRNINCTVAESLKRFEKVATEARAAGARVRGYVSCAVGCPYEGRVEPQAAADVAAALQQMGCYEVSMADTIGVGTPASMEAMLKATLRQVSADKLAVHCHDTYGMAIANILTSLRMGVSVVDSSVAGLGGCPYARGATGNVATEDVLYMLDGYGIVHGIDMDAVLRASEFISGALGRPNGSRVARALLARRADADDAAADAAAAAAAAKAAAAAAAAKSAGPTATAA